MKRCTPRISLCFSLLTITAITASLGCKPQAATTDPARVAAERARLLLAEEPAGAVTLGEWREANPDATEGEVVLVGQVGGMPNPWEDTEKHFPWRAGEASVFLVDPATAAEFADHSHGEGDDHQDCPFCTRAASQSVDSVTAVSFIDDQGATVPIDTRELLPLEEGTVAVVRGKAKLLAGDLMVVEADGIYIRE